MTPTRLATILSKIRHDPRAVDEVREFQPAVIATAEKMGYQVRHEPDPRRSKGGLLDLRLIRGRRFMYVELKSEVGKMSKEQVAEAARLTRAGIEWHCFRPSEWDSRVLPCLKARERWMEAA